MVLVLVVLVLVVLVLVVLVMLVLRIPNGIRTRAAAVKGRSPRPLDDGDLDASPSTRVEPLATGQA